jgi:NRPS condensation-like uncharacterized protein
MTATRRPLTVRLSRLDELYLVLDDGREPWNVHFEAHCTGRLDADRLVDAIRTAARRHPLARARLTSWHYADRGYHWQIDDALVDVPLRVVPCPDDAALATAREHLLERSPPLDAPPPFELLLARGPAGDSLVLNLHHAVADGISAMRLLASILRAYAGEDDPSPPLDPLAVREVHALAGASTLADRLLRVRALAQHGGTRAGGPARVALDEASDRPGYGVELLALSREETVATRDRRTEGTTVNDVLLAALAVAIRRWNKAHGAPNRRVMLSMPINLRPPEWRTDVLGNFASYVSLSGSIAASFQSALECIGRQTRAVERDGLGGVVVDMLAGCSVLTTASRRAFADVTQASGSLAVDSASLSDLGVLPSMGDGVESVWFSPPGRMPLGVAVGAATHDGRIRLAIRYRYEQFDRAAARSFALLYRDTLVTG